MKTPVERQIAVVDYGIGNLLSVARALEHCGAEVIVSSDPKALSSARAMVLPGVGAFADGMAGLARRGLDKVVVDFAASGKPLLGICLGMQMLASIGEEFGEHRGLNLIPGRVTRIPVNNAAGIPHKVPHVGWADLEAPFGIEPWRNSVLSGLGEHQAIYLTHSFAVHPDDRQDLLATYRSHDITVTAAIRRGNITGVQFHPEKSAHVGLQILRNFLAAANDGACP